jgi:hypothetical protein
MTTRRHGPLITTAIFVLTVLQLAVATFSGLSQFQSKGFAARLIAYPLMMLVAPAIWFVLERRRRAAGSPATTPPWAAFSWIMLPFLIDVSGNSANLYDSISWWDDVNHLVNWFFLSLGTGTLLVRGRTRPGLELAVLITGIGAVMAIGWEIGEYFAFIRGGTELDTAYTDTLGDETLGTIGAALAGTLIAVRAGRKAEEPVKV